MPLLNPASHTGRTLLRVALLLVPLAIVAGGCSSNSKSNSTATPPADATSAPSPTATATGPSPTSATESATADGSGGFNLQPDANSTDAYTIEVPVGWQAENIPEPGGFGRRYSFILNGAQTAQVTVRCQAGGTVADLMQADQSIVTSLGGVYGTGGSMDVTVGGMPGKQTGYTLTVGGRPQETRVLYLQGKICGWVLLLQAFGAGQLAHYTPLFNAIVATFNPVMAGG